MSPASPVPHRGMITLSIMLATIMQALDTTIANVALPHMQGSLQASQDQITWVLTSYIVASAIALPLTGWLCGRYGRRKVFLISVVGFTIASALCGLAGSLTGIVAARLLQGVFGAALVPLSQAVLLDINPREKVGQAMRAQERAANLLSFAYVRKKLSHRSDPFWLTRPTKCRRDSLKKLVHVGQQKVLRAVEMGIERGTTDAGFI